MWPFDGIVDDKNRFNDEGGLIDQFEMQYGVRNWGGQSDLNAVGHAYTSAGLTLEHGRILADLAGQWKEVFGSSGSSREDSSRDLHNNNIGQQIGNYAISADLPESVLDELVYDALVRGILIVDEFEDPRMFSGRYGTTPAMKYDGPSEDVARSIERILGLAEGFLSVGYETGPGLPIEPFFPPSSSLRPRSNPFWEVTKCFPAHTRIQTSRTTSTAISALRVGDVVLAFDARADKGRGALVPRRVTQAYRNTTTDWIRLRWVDGTAREVITTPGHHFLDEFGLFPTPQKLVHPPVGCASAHHEDASRNPFCSRRHDNRARLGTPRKGRLQRPPIPPPGPQTCRKPPAGQHRADAAAFIFYVPHLARNFTREISPLSHAPRPAQGAVQPYHGPP